MEGLLEKIKMANNGKGGIWAWWQVTDLAEHVIKDGVKC